MVGVSLLSDRVALKRIGTATVSIVAPLWAMAGFYKHPAQRGVIMVP
jgi:hypothetical protein